MNEKFCSTNTTVMSNFQNFHSTFVVVHVKRRKKIEGRTRKLSPVRHQTCIVSFWNHEPSSELLRCVRGVCPNFRQTCQFLYHIILVAWHYSTKVSCVSDFFWELKCHVTPCIRIHVSMSWEKFVWKFLLVYCTWN